jgi:GSH-dependent disulfide-bond oxidoreductase
MIRCYAWKTPNGYKIPIALEELGVAWTLHPIDISKDEQFDPAFLAIAPNNKIPAIVDDDPVGGGEQAVFESGAILQYLAEKTGKLLAPSGPARWAALEWLNWQIGGLGPMLGQLGFFAVRSEEKASLAIDRFVTEGERLLGVLERRLAAVPYLAGDEFSIADIAAFTWTRATRAMLKEPLAKAIADAPATERWLATIADRPAVQRGLAVFS